MCGFIGFVDLSKRITQSEIDIATEKMKLRGPDSHGAFIQEYQNYNVGFGHRRLAVLDLDKRSDQPFTIDDLTIVYNGEIYNFKDIKSDLISIGIEFNTTSDTEVILRAYQQWGELCVNRFKGMFAFFLFDQTNERIIIVRDRLGIKPLYLYQVNNQLIVASQISAIQTLINNELTIDESALNGFFSLGYVPGERSIFKEIKKVKPASIVVINLKNGLQSKESIFWEINNIPNNQSEAEKSNQLEQILEDAISLRRIADVKVGSFLSGGLDSSYVTKVLQQFSKVEKINTFTIGFRKKFDEAPHAQLVAEHIGTNHFSHYLEPDDIKDIIFNYAEYFDEPFSDDAGIPMLFLSRKAKNHVKVIVSSDGGDEVFAGYSRYIKTIRVFKILKLAPYWSLLLAKYTSTLIWNILPKRNKISNALWRFIHIIDSDKTRLLPNILFYGDLIPTPELENVISSEILNKDINHNFFQTTENFSPLKKLLYIDSKERLVNQMLVKVDKATMGASIEGREPLMDHRLFEFMSGLKDEDLIKDNKTKYIFRRVIEKRFSNSNILNKPKMGFDTPIYDWLRYSFPDFVEEEFKSVEVLSIPYLKYKELILMWNDFKAGKVYYQNLVWRILIYILWYKKYVIEIKK